MHKVVAEAGAFRVDEGKRNFIRGRKKRERRVRGGVAESQEPVKIGHGENVVERRGAGQRGEEEEEAEAQRETQREEQGSEVEEGEARAKKSYG